METLTNIHTILVPLDHTKITEELVQIAIAWQKRTNGKLFFLHVGMEGGIHNSGQLDTFKEFLEKIGNLPEYEAVYKEGNSAIEIVNTANELNADLIIMGAHDHTMLDRLFLGSNTDYVIHKCSCPVYVHKRYEGEFTDKIIVPIDYSAVNKTVIALADQLAQEKGAELLFVHADPPLEPYNLFGLGSVISSDMAQSIQKNYNEALEEDARNHEFTLKRYLEGCEIQSSYKCVSLTGKPYDCILQAQTDNKAGLIIMAAHSHTTMNRILNGSNTDFLLHHAPCPMFVYKESVLHEAKEEA